MATDPTVGAKLEACATGKPNEHSTHFTVNSKGEHVRLVQVALDRVKKREPGLKIPEFKVDGNYSPEFARAVFAYKKGRGIKNFASKIDDIVGINTIISLDKEEGNGGDQPTPVFPPNTPTSIPVKSITQRVFVFISQSGGGKPDFGDTGLDTPAIIDAVKQIFNSFQDPDFFLGKEDLNKRKVELIDEDNGVNFVQKNVTSDIRTGLGAVVTNIVTTVFIYQYGKKNADVVVNSKFRSIIDGDAQSSENNTKSIARAEAEKSQVLVPARIR